MDPQQNTPVQPQVGGQPITPQPITPPIQQTPQAQTFGPSPVAEAIPEQQPIVTPAPGPATFIPDPTPVQPVVTVPSEPQGAVVGNAVSQPPVGPQPNMLTLSQMPASAGGMGGKKKLLIKLAILLVGVAILAGGVIYGLKFFGGISLEKFSKDNYSLLVPKDYEKKEEAQQILFEEKGGDKETHSGVIIVRQTFPKLTADQMKQVQSAFESELKRFPETFTKAGESLEGATVDKIKHNGEDALSLKATVLKDGKKVGTIKALAILKDDGVYIVVVAAHTSDPALVKKMDAILDSFKID